jgi:hypothetical protein
LQQEVVVVVALVECYQAKTVKPEQLAVVGAAAQPVTVALKVPAVNKERPEADGCHLD